MKSLAPAIEREDAGPGAVDVCHGEHLAAGLPVADPIGQIVLPFDGLHHMRQPQTEGTDALVVHEVSVRRKEQLGKTKSSSMESSDAG